MKNVLTILTALLLAPLAGLQAAELTFAGPFTDHAVLQRDAATPVWGSADPSEKVTVTFGGQTKTTTADANGKWFVKLDPMPASAKGRELVVRSTIKNRESRISDVVVGDVWVASGQSNMARKFNVSHEPDIERPKAKYPQIRMITAKPVASLQPLDEIEGSWQECSPETVDVFSAVGYYFARDLHKKLGVPVGIINNSLGATRAQAWTSAEGFEGHPELNDFADRLKKAAALKKPPKRKGAQQ